jgi:hypothetical protein
MQVKRLDERGEASPGASSSFLPQGFFSHYLGAFPNTILQAVLLVCEFAKNGE